jgi:SAM-dependent methyltransferase
MFLPMVPIFREGPGPHTLAVGMTAVRMGERQLLVGDDGPLFAQLALKAGLTGRVCAVAGSEPSAARVRAAAADAGVLMDVESADLPALPASDDEYDVAVIEAGATVLTRLDQGGRIELARAVCRALRPGGRAVVVEGRPPRLFGLLRTRPAGLDAFRCHGGATAMLEAAGFYPVRLLADRDGQRFTEGLKKGTGG